MQSRSNASVGEKKSTKLIDHIISNTELKRKDNPFWNFKFDGRAYFNDFEYESIGKHIVVCFFLLLFGNYFMDTVFQKTIGFIASNINSGILGNLLFYYFGTLYIGIFFIKRILKGFLPTINSVVAFFLYLIIYNSFRTNDYFAFLPEGDYLIKYIDIIFVFFALILSKWSIYFERRNTNNINYQFIIDDKNHEDLFGYSGLANQVNEFIHNTETPHSFAIAVIGNWGDGKSYLANKIHEHFKEFSDDYIIVDFNPWLYNKDKLVEGFFNEFLAACTFDRSLHKDLLKYLNLLAEGPEFEKLKLINLTLRTIGDHKSLAETKKTISDKIRLSRKKIIVLLDDTDRLDKEEIQEVLKIIRNCADFANTFFVTGIDYAYIHTQLEHPRYLEKIFNVIVALPKITSTPLKEEILRKFNLHFPSDKDLINALNDLTQHEWFMSMVKNIRHLNRLINSLKIAYIKLKGNADMTDLLILEAIKNWKTDIYWNIQRGEILEYSFMRDVANGINENKGWIILEKGNTIEAPVKNALQYLITHKSNSHMRAFSNGYDLLYFNYSFAGVDIIEFYKLLENNDTEIVKRLNKWISVDTSTRAELLHLITLHLTKDATTNFEKYIPILLQLEDNFASNVFLEIYQKTITNLDIINLKLFLQNILKEIEKIANEKPEVAINWTFNVVRTVLRTENKNEILRADSADFMDTVSKIYQTALDITLHSDKLFETKYDTFKDCVIGIKDNIYQYDPGCITIFRNYVLSDDKYLIAFIQHSVIPLYNNIYTDHTRQLGIVDFISIILNNKERLLTKLNHLTESEVGPLIRFLIQHIDDYFEFRKQGTKFSRYVKDELLHKELLEYFSA